MTKKELYKFLKDNAEIYDYYIVTWDNHTEPLYFMPFENAWFESPLEVRRYPMTEEELWEIVKETYSRDYWEKGFKIEQEHLIDGYLYDIDCPQCLPFLPETIDDIYGISERDMLEKIIVEKEFIND